MSGIAAFLYENYRKQITTQEVFDMRRRLFWRSKLLGQFILDYYLWLVGDFKTLDVHVIELVGVAEVHHEVNGCLECYVYYSRSENVKQIEVIIYWDETVVQCVQIYLFTYSANSLTNCCIRVVPVLCPVVFTVMSGVQCLLCTGRLCWVRSLTACAW